MSNLDFDLVGLLLGHTLASVYCSLVPTFQLSQPTLTSDVNTSSVGDDAPASAKQSFHWPPILAEPAVVVRRLDLDGKFVVMTWRLFSWT